MAKKGMAGVYKGNMIGSKGNVSASDGPSAPAGKPAPSGRMGTKKGSAPAPSQGGDPSGPAKGLSRTKKGKNRTGSGPQGFS